MVAGIVPILPRVSSPANASATTRDAKRLGVGREWPPGLLRPFSSRGLSSAHLADRFTVVLAEIRNGLELRHEAAAQPDQLDIALALPLDASARLNAIEVPVNVDLQQRGRPSRRPWLDTATGANMLS